MLANSMINRCGPTMAVRLADETGAAGIAEIAAAFAAGRNAFALTDLNGEIDALDAQISGQLQLELYAELQALVLDATGWFLRNGDFSSGLAAVIDHYHNGIAALAKALPEAIPEEARQAHAGRRDDLVAAGVPEPLAERLAMLPWLARGLDIILIADRTGRPLPAVAATFFAVGERFAIPELIEDAEGLTLGDYFDRLAVNRTLELLMEAQRRLTGHILADGDASASIDDWLETCREQAGRVHEAIGEIRRGPMSLSRLAVAASLLGELSALG